MVTERCTRLRWLREDACERAWQVTRAGFLYRKGKYTRAGFQQGELSTYTRTGFHFMRGVQVHAQCVECSRAYACRAELACGHGLKNMVKCFEASRDNNSYIGPSHPAKGVYIYCTSRCLPEHSTCLPSTATSMMQPNLQREEKDMWVPCRRKRGCVFSTAAHV